jgi:hypothetical protein
MPQLVCLLTSPFLQHAAQKSTLARQALQARQGRVPPPGAGPEQCSITSKAEGVVAHAQWHTVACRALQAAEEGVLQHTLCCVIMVPAAQQAVPDTLSLRGQARHGRQHAANLVDIAIVVVTIVVERGGVPIRQMPVADLRAANIIVRTPCVAAHPCAAFTAPTNSCCGCCSTWSKRTGHQHINCCTC